MFANNTCTKVKGSSGIITTDVADHYDVMHVITKTKVVKCPQHRESLVFSKYNIALINQITDIHSDITRKKYKYCLWHVPCFMILGPHGSFPSTYGDEVLPASITNMLFKYFI
jgi:hypothetical protein